jgi:hypothetical protein
MAITMHTTGNSLNIGAGIRSAASWGTFGAVAAAVVVAAVGINERWLLLTELGEYRGWFNWFLERAMWPVLGAATVFVCAGWITGSARPRIGIVFPLILISLVSIAAWYVIGISEILPRRLKGVEHPPIYFAEFLALVVPPVITAVLLTTSSNKSSNQ